MEKRVPLSNACCRPREVGCLEVSPWGSGVLAIPDQLPMHPAARCPVLKRSPAMAAWLLCFPSAVGTD